MSLRERDWGSHRLQGSLTSYSYGPAFPPASPPGYGLESKGGMGMGATLLAPPLVDLSASNEDSPLQPSPPTFPHSSDPTYTRFSILLEMETFFFVTLSKRNYTGN